VIDRYRVMRVIERPHRWNWLARLVPPGLRDLFTFQFVVVARKR
jgi:hypothetical protein